MIPMYLDDLDKALQASTLNLENIKHLNEKELIDLLNRTDQIINTFKLKIEDFMKNLLNLLDGHSRSFFVNSRQIEKQKQTYYHFFLSLFNNIAANKLLERKNLVALRLHHLLEATNSNELDKYETLPEILSIEQNRILKHWIKSNKIKELLLDLNQMTDANVLLQKQTLLINFNYTSLTIDRSFHLLTNEDFEVRMNRLIFGIINFIDAITQNTS